MRQLIILVTFSYLISACSLFKSTGKNEGTSVPTDITTDPAGNGQGYGGGDGPLSDARGLYVKAVSILNDNSEIARFTDNTACNSTISEPILCNYLVGLTPEQKAFLQTYVKKHAHEMIALNTGEARVKFVFTNDVIKLGTGSDASRDLAAKTELSKNGAIYFHEPSVNALSAYRQIALVAHEIGHKTYTDLVPSHFINDTESVGPFANGLVFLDTLGASLAIYLAGTYGKTIVLFPDKVEACKPEYTKPLFFGSPYYKAPASTSVLGGQVSAESNSFLRNLSKSFSNLTVTAWVQVFNEKPENTRFRGEAILSNISNTAEAFQYITGFGLFRLSNGNFGAYAAGAYLQDEEERTIDSGIALSPGKFHLVAFKQEIVSVEVYNPDTDTISTSLRGEIKLYVDGMVKNTVTNVPLFDNSNFLTNILNASYDRGVSIGRAAREPRECYDRGAMYNHMCMSHFEGHIAQVSFYSKALSHDEIVDLGTCVPK